MLLIQDPDPIVDELLPQYEAALIALRRVHRMIRESKSPAPADLELLVDIESRTHTIVEKIKAR